MSDKFIYKITDKPRNENMEQDIIRRNENSQDMITDIESITITDTTELTEITTEKRNRAYRFYIAANDLENIRDFIVDNCRKGRIYSNKKSNYNVYIELFDKITKEELSKMIPEESIDINTIKKIEYVPYSLSLNVVYEYDEATVTKRIYRKRKPNKDVNGSNKRSK